MWFLYQDSSGTSYFAGENIKWYSHFKKSLTVSWNDIHTFTTQQTNPIFRNHLKEMKTCIYINIFMGMFLAALLTKTKRPEITQMFIYWIDKCDISRQWNTIQQLREIKTSTNFKNKFMKEAWHEIPLIVWLHLYEKKILRYIK